MTRQSLDLGHKADRRRQGIIQALVGSCALLPIAALVYAFLELA